MTKYSTGGGSGSTGGGSCELCGAPSETLRDASIAGAQLSVCKDCAPHDDRRTKEPERRGARKQGDRRRRAAQQAARIADARKGDADYWVEKGTDYESDPLPYLVSGYGGRLEEARQAAGLTVEELASQVNATASEIEAIEQNRAARASVGGSVIRAIEDELELTLAEEA